jgi:hypothetical protein
MKRGFNNNNNNNYDNCHDSESSELRVSQYSVGRRRKNVKLHCTALNSSAARQDPRFEPCQRGNEALVHVSLMSFWEGTSNELLISWLLMSLYEFQILRTFDWGTEDDPGSGRNISWIILGYVDPLPGNSCVNRRQYKSCCQGTAV